MATAKSTLLKTKRPGKDLNDPLFSDILAWTNDNASDLRLFSANNRLDQGPDR